MPTKIHGLPAHILLVHAVIVLVPLAAGMLVASAVWPTARAKLGLSTPAVALVALIFVPITTNAGKWLRDHLPNNFGRTDPLVQRHTHLGGRRWPEAIALFVMASAVWLLGRRYEMSWRPADGNGTARKALPVWATALVAVVSVAVAFATIVELYRIGESGSKSVWRQL